MEYLKKNILNSLNLNLKLEEEAIQTLSNRLQHATLSADRRSAVLGLKSFSRQFRESVVEYGIRPLLQTLEKDSGSLSTVKAVMETLIILFIRGGNEDNEALGWISNQSRIQNGKYPSPSLMTNLEMDQFSMWIADEVISCDDYLKAMVDTLHSSQDFHIRLYTLQFLEALVATRGTRTKECLINIPLAVSTIVSLLNDPNDPVRNEAILLLMALVRDNFNIQKLVAFENTFDRLFEIIEEEGGIRGSILVQDCLTLLTNLLMYNASNQKFFLETDCVPKLARLLAEPIDSSSDESTVDDPLFSAAPIVWTEQRLQNMSIALEICKSFVDKDNQQKEQNQNRLYQAGIFFSIMRLTFSHLTEIPIRKTALEITGDLIASNKDLQYEFSRIDVPYIDPSLPIQIQRYDKSIPAPLALLNWCLLSNSVHTFEIRLSSAYCLQSLFMDNNEAKIAFLTDQIRSNENPNYYNELEKPEENDITVNDAEPIPLGVEEENLEITPYANIFSTLTNFDFEVKLNPYRVWFASIILIYLFEECPENKEAAQKVTIGNSEDGEEVMTSIQAISEIFTASLENSDPRIAIGLLLLLTVWLFEDFAAVNDFLEDSAIIKTLLGFLSKNSAESSTLVHGMSAILVGITYEFSTKSSPIPRTELYSIITKALGADNYSLKVKQFRECEEFRHFTDPLTASFEKDSTGLPKVYFIENYLELVKDNFHRIRKALSRDPLVEPQLRISYEAFEELETKYANLTREMSELREKSEENEKYLKLKVSEAEKDLENSNALLQHSSSHLEQLRDLESTLTSKIEKLAKDLKFMESERTKFERSSIKLAEELEKSVKANGTNEMLLNQLKLKFEIIQTEKLRAEDGINKMSRELFQLTKQQKESHSTIATLEEKIKSIEASKKKLATDYENQFESLRRANDNYKAKVKILETQLKELSDDRDRKAFKIREFQDRLTDAESNNSNLLEKLRTAAALVQHLRKANPDMKEDKSSILAAILQSQEESKATRELETDILRHQEKIRELEFLMLQAKNSATEVERNLREEISLLSVEMSKHTENERALRDEIDKLQSDLEEQSNRSKREKESYEEQVQALEKEKFNLHTKLSDYASESIEERTRLEIALENLKKDSNDREALLNTDLETKTEELIEMQDKQHEQLEFSLSLQRQLDEQIEKFKNLSVKSISEKDEFERKNTELLSQIELHKLKLEASLEESKIVIQKLEAQVKDLQENAKSSMILEEDKKIQKEQEVRLQRELQEKDGEINDLKEQIQKLTVNEKSLALELQDLVLKLTEDNSKTLGELNRQIEELTEEKSNLSEELSKNLEIQTLNFTSEREMLSHSIKSEKENLKSILLRLENTSKVIKEYEEVIETKSKTIEDQSKIINDQVEFQELQGRLHQDLQSKLEEEINSLKTRINDLNKSKSDLNDMLQAFELQKHEFEDELSKTKESKLLLELELEEVQVSKLDIEAELTAKVALIEELENLIKSEREMKSQEEFLSRVESQEPSEATKEALTKEVTNKIGELVAKDQLIREIKRKLEDSTFALEELTEKNVDLISEKKESIDELKKLSAELKASQKNASNLEKRLAKLGKGLEEDDYQDLEGYRERVLELKQKLDEDENRYQELQKSYDIEIDSLKTDKDTLNDQCQILMHERDILAAENDKNEHDCKELQNTVFALEVKLEQVNDELNEKKEEIQIKENELNDLKLSIESTKDELKKNNIQSEKDQQEMNAAREDLNSQIESLTRELIAKNNEFTDILSRISSFEDTLDHKNESLSKAHEVLTQRSEDIRILEKELEQKETNINKLKERLEKALINDEEAKDTLVTQREELAISERGIESLTLQLSEIKSSHDGLQKEFDLLKDNYEDTVSQLDTEKDALEECHQKLHDLEISHNDYVLYRDNEIKETRGTLGAEINALKGGLRKKEEELFKASLEKQQLEENWTKELKEKEEYIKTKKHMQEDLDSNLETIARLETQLSDSVSRTLTLETDKNIAQITLNEDKSQLQAFQNQIETLQLAIKTKDETITSINAEVDKIKADLHTASLSLKAAEEANASLESTVSAQLQKANDEIQLAENLTNRLEELEKQLAASQRKLKEEESLRLQAESTVCNLQDVHRKELGDLRMELAAKEKLQADFEDLMLLWEDQEEKVENYKQRLRDNNQPLSSDDEC